MIEEKNLGFLKIYEDSDEFIHLLVDFLPTLIENVIVGDMFVTKDAHVHFTEASPVEKERTGDEREFQCEEEGDENRYRPFCQPRQLENLAYFMR